MDLGETFWVGAISELDSVFEPVWFVGTRLSWWLKTGIYRGPLRAKLTGRLQTISGRRGTTKPAEGFITNIVLADANAAPIWKAFVQDIIDELTSDFADDDKESAESFYWSKIKINVVPSDVVRYSLILCGERLIVINYISSGRSDDSPTIDIQRGSVVWQLYINDLKFLREKIGS